MRDHCPIFVETEATRRSDWMCVASFHSVICPINRWHVMAPFSPGFREIIHIPLVHAETITPRLLISGCPGRSAY